MQMNSLGTGRRHEMSIIIVRLLCVYFSDLVLAYKGLSKEKEALDASFKILSQKKSENEAPLSDQKKKIEGEDQSNCNEKENQFTDPLQVTNQVRRWGLMGKVPIPSKLGKIVAK